MKMNKLSYFLFSMLFLIFIATGIKAEVNQTNMTITTNMTLNDTVYNIPEGITISSDNIELNCNGAEIRGNSSFDGINVTGRTGVTIKNCVLIGYKNGVHLISSSNNIVKDNYAEANGLWASYHLEQNSNNNLFTNNTAVVNSSPTNNLLFGFFISYYSNNNVFSDNKVYGGNWWLVSGFLSSNYNNNNSFINNMVNDIYIGFYVYNVNNNKIINNTITNNSFGVHFGIFSLNPDVLGNLFSGNIINENERGFSFAECTNIQNRLNITNNRFYDNDYDFYNICSFNVSLENNWFGTNNVSEISSKIYDYYDDNSKGRVNFEPFLTLQSISLSYPNNNQVFSSSDNNVNMTFVISNNYTTVNSCSLLINNVINQSIIIGQLLPFSRLYDDFSSTVLNNNLWSESIGTNVGGGQLDKHEIRNGVYHTFQLNASDNGTSLNILGYNFQPGDFVEYDVNYINGSGNRIHVINVDGDYLHGVFGYWNGIDGVGNNSFGNYHLNVSFTNQGATAQVTLPNGTQVIHAHTFGSSGQNHTFGLVTRTGNEGTVEMDYDNVVIKTLTYGFSVNQLPSGSYIWNVSCNDSFNYTAYSDSRTFTIESPAITTPSSNNGGGGGGGGGGGSSNRIVNSTNQTTNGNSSNNSNSNNNSGSLQQEENSQDNTNSAITGAVVGTNIKKYALPVVIFLVIIVGVSLLIWKRRVK